MQGSRLVLAAAAMVACHGCTDSGSSLPAGPDENHAGAAGGSNAAVPPAGQASEPRCSTIVGEYEVSALIVDESAQTLDTQVHLSIAPTADGCAATLAGAWQKPVPYAMHWSASELLLSPVDASSTACEEEHSPDWTWESVWGRTCWTALRFTLEADGLGRQLTAEVKNDGFDIDAGSGWGPLSTPASLSADAVLPRLTVVPVVEDGSGRYRHPTNLAPGEVPTVFPWSELRIGASEVVDDLATGLAFASPEPAHDAWRVVTDGDFGSGIATRFTNWDEARGREFTIVTTGPLTDEAGNPVQTGEAPVFVLDVGPAATRHEFETAPEGYGVWDTTSDAECALDGCVVTHTLAAQVLADQASTVAVRLRLVPYWPSVETVLASVYVVDSGGTVAAHEIRVGLEWLEASFPLPGAGTYGVVISMPKTDIEDYELGSALIDYVEAR